MKIKKLDKIAMIIVIYQLLGCNLSTFFTSISQTERLEVNSGRLAKHFVNGAIKMGLTKAQIVEKIVEQNGFPKNRSSKLLENLLEVIKHTLVSGEDVLISGFGKFCVKEKGERQGRSPETGESMMLAPRRFVTFKCSRKLRQRINA